MPNVDDMDHFHTDEIVCPYCGHKSTDSNEYLVDDRMSGEIDCDECGNTFSYEANLEIKYTTRKIKEADDAEAQAEPS